MSIQCKVIRNQLLSLRGDYRYKLKLVLCFSRPSLSPRLEPIWRLSSRPFCDKVGDKGLETNLTDSNEDKMKDNYPVLDSKKYKQERPLVDLIRELKGEPMEDAVTPAVNQINQQEKKFGLKNVRRFTVKYHPAARVSALEKHFDLIDLQKKKDNSSARKQKMLDFIPDDSEVGELLKSLITKEKFTDHDVKDVMSNIRPKIKPAGHEKKMRGRPDRSMGLPSQRARRFENRSNLFNGPASQYFDLSSNWEDLSADGKFVSIHEKKFNQTITSSVPHLGPTNAFEVLMLEADKSWRFPIDNEVGLDDVDQSTFEDHVFLSEYLELFPVKGEVRRFMELVITGLQQNPYFSVKEKVDKIHWFKEYFEKFSAEDLDF